MNFTSPYSKSEIIKRFRAAVDPAWRFGGSAPVIGWTSAGTLHARKRIGYRNSFQTVLTARMRPAGAATHVTVTAGMSGFAVIFLCVWLALAAGAGVAVLFSSAPEAALVPGGLFIFGICLAGAGRYFARSEAAELTAFLVETLDLDKV